MKRNRNNGVKIKRGAGALRRAARRVCYLARVCAGMLRIALARAAAINGARCAASRIASMAQRRSRAARAPLRAAPF